MSISMRDPRLKEKLINHPDYLIPKALPKKPTNPNALRNWREDCKAVRKETSPQNLRLLKKIWAEWVDEEV